MEFQATIQGFANSFFQPLADNVLTKPEFFIGIVVFKEPATAARLFFAALLVTGIIGLKLSSGH